jgi:hypothetical protein
MRKYFINHLDILKLQLYYVFDTKYINSLTHYVGLWHWFHVAEFTSLLDNQFYLCREAFFCHYCLYVVQSYTPEKISTVSAL